MNLLLDTCPLLWASEPTTEVQPAAARTAARSAQSGMGQRRERLGVTIKGDRDRETDWRRTLAAACSQGAETRMR